ncbi:MAG: spore maturation protein [Bacteroidales bacterium]|nr:spore maturation protein [Bacteroidales bacterium]MBN2819550.1 spore maturation protein [Bacteroidales bacterium]
MALNYIWLGFFLIAFVVALLRVVGYNLQNQFDWFASTIFDVADHDVFSEIVMSTFDMAEYSVKLSIYLIGVMTLWLGIMRIGEKGGAINALAKVTSPFFVRIFPDIPKNHPAMGSMLMNFCANMLGLDNAATPFGLKAMDQLQELNKDKDTASNSQIMFLVLNTSGLTIIPISIMAYRAAENAANPADVFLPLLMATFFSTLAGLITVSFIQKINLFNKVVIAYIGGLSLIIAGIFTGLKHMQQEQITVFSNFIGNFILFGFIVFFLVLGIRKKLPFFEVFIDGAKEGFTVAIKIIPYLVGMLVGIGVFRASGAFDWIINGIGWFFAFLGFDTQFVDALPTAFMKPLSGSGARGMMVETMRTYGADSFAGRLASVFQGSTETTFYTVAVYYGAISVKNTRYTIGAGLIADLAGAIAAILIMYWLTNIGFFGG